MTLNDEEQHILAGKFGPVARQALQHQLKVGEFFSAKGFVPVTHAHVIADTESLGDAGVRWLEGLAAGSEDQRHMRVPTITDPRGTDLPRLRFWARRPRSPPSSAEPFNPLLISTRRTTASSVPWMPGASAVSCYHMLLPKVVAFQPPRYRRLP